MKKILLTILAMSVLTVSTFAQNTSEDTGNTGVKRELSFYLDAFSGELTGDPDKPNQPYLFKGNEFEFGMTYSQNFAKAQWLSMWVKTLVVTGINPAWDRNGDYLGNAGGVGVYGFGMPRVQLGLNFGGHAIIAMDTRGLIAQEAYYTLDFGKGGSLTFIQILEFFAFPQALGNTKDETLISEGLGEGAIDLTGKVTVVDLFSLRMDYGISFAKKFRFNSKSELRFGGSASDISATAFKESFSIRWENQLIYSVTPKFYMWTQVRYTIYNLANDLKSTHHRVGLQAGLGYIFDFSKN